MLNHEFFHEKTRDSAHDALAVAGSKWYVYYMTLLPCHADLSMPDPLSICEDDWELEEVPKWKLITTLLKRHGLVQAGQGRSKYTGLLTP